MGDDHLISLQPGTVLGGKYEVVKCLGSGSMGLVYACRHRELQGHMVAVKVLFPEVAQDKVAAARFRNEIFASYGVSHPNVVRAYEYLRDGDLVAYTMEYVGGGDLAERLSRNERMGIAEVVRLLSQMTAGVQAIHDAGIVHRDLKPENILLTKEGNVKIADFGIARNRHGPKLTEHGGVVGTIDYVAPEYMLKSQVDWRSDIYALGILAYEMLTGEAPFRGDSVYATMTKRLKTDPEPPSKLRPECPTALDNIIFKAMNRDPLQRYQAAMEMFLDLQKLANDQGLRTAVSNGFYMQSAPAQNQTYVGPSVSTGGEDNSALFDMEGEHAKPAATTIATSNQAVGPGGGVSIGAQSSMSNAWRGSDNMSDAATRSLSQTARIEMTGALTRVDDNSSNPPTENIMGIGGAGRSKFNHRSNSNLTENNNSASLDPVLAVSNDLVSDGWGIAGKDDGHRGVISTRVRDLSHKYQEQQSRRSYLLDAILLLVAMIFGVAFGCMVLKMLFPSILSSLPFIGGS